MDAPVLPTCGKIPYVTVAETRSVVKSIKSRGVYVRPYQCRVCTYWHLTSRPDKARVKKGW